MDTPTQFSAAPTPGKKDKLGLWIGVIVVLVIVIAFIYSLSQPPSPVENLSTGSENSAPAAAQQTPAQSAEAIQDINGIQNELQANTSTEVNADLAPIDQTVKGL